MNCPYPECQGTLIEDFLVCSTCNRSSSICENADCGAPIPSAADYCTKCGARQSRVRSWRSAGGGASHAGTYNSPCTHQGTGRIQVSEEWSYAPDRRVVKGLIEIGGFLFIPTAGGRVEVVRILDGKKAKIIEVGGGREILALPAVHNMCLYVFTNDKLSVIPIHDLFGNEEMMAHDLAVSTSHDLGIGGEQDSTEIVPGRSHVAFTVRTKSGASIFSLSDGGDLVRRAHHERTTPPILDPDDSLYLGTESGVLYKYSRDLASVLLSTEEHRLPRISLEQAPLWFSNGVMLCDGKLDLRYSVPSGKTMRFGRITLGETKVRVFSIRAAGGGYPGHIAVSGTTSCHLFQELFARTYELKATIKRTSFTQPIILDSFVIFALDNGRCHFFSRAEPAVQDEYSIGTGAPIMLPMAASPDGAVFVASEDRVFKLRANIS